MALAFRRSMKTLGWFYWVAKAEPMYRLQQKPSVQAANSSFGGLYKVLHQHLKIRFNSNGFCSSVGDALTVRQMSTDTALRRDAQEECQGVAEETQPKQQKRKKLKGKVAVIKWLTFIRWKKKKEYERMTPEEKIMFKLKKAAPGAASATVQTGDDIPSGDRYRKATKEGSCAVNRDWNNTKNFNSSRKNILYWYSCFRGQLMRRDHSRWQHQIYLVREGTEQSRWFLGSQGTECVSTRIIGDRGRARTNTIYRRSQSRYRSYVEFIPLSYAEGDGFVRVVVRSLNAKFTGSNASSIQRSKEEWSPFLLAGNKVASGTEDDSMRMDGSWGSEGDKSHLTTPGDDLQSNCPGMVIVDLDVAMGEGEPSALEKLEPKQSSDPIHDPEILTPEEHFYYLKMGHKCKNYVPIGRRGVFGGVILNMHLHWKKHQTLKVIVKTFTPDEVREIAGELARLSGGIVLDIYEGNTIIMYRGKNYAQPPTEIMTPRITLSKRKALDKSNYRDSLRSVRLFIPRLEKDLEMLRQQMIKDSESKSNTEHGRTVMMSNGQKAEADNFPNDSEPVMQHFPKGRESVAEHATEAEDLSESCGTESEHASETEFGMVSDSEALSDMFETDSDMKSDSSDELDDALYLDKIDAVPLEDKKTSVDFGEHSSKMLEDAKKTDGSADEPYLSELDEVDRMFLRASSLLKKRK